MTGSHHKKSHKDSKKASTSKKRQDDNHNSSDKYYDALKECHNKDNKKKECKTNKHKKEKNSNDASNTHSKSYEKHNKHHNSHESNSHVKSRKHEAPSEESYEELSRKKRKIESELRALELEEAAEKKAEEKRSHKGSNRHSRRNGAVLIKQEALSDGDESNKQSWSKEKYPKHHVKNINSSKQNSSKSSDNENAWGKPKDEVKKESAKPKEKPSFEVSGKLAEDTNTYNGVVIKYNEPVEARKAKKRWRLYPFKGDTDLPFIPIHRQSAYLFGRTRAIADIPIDHPSCSKQHAVLQFRLVSYKRDDGTNGRRVRPYIIDLESSNGTYINNKKVDPRCYVELMEKDVIKFGYSSREYVILHEESKNDEDDEDVVD